MVKLAWSERLLSIVKARGFASLVNDPLQFANTQPASGIAEISRFELARYRLSADEGLKLICPFPEVLRAIE
jgi:hypothetical protein